MNTIYLQWSRECARNYICLIMWPAYITWLSHVTLRGRTENKMSIQTSTQLILVCLAMFLISAWGRQKPNFIIMLMDDASILFFHFNKGTNYVSEILMDEHRSTSIPSVFIIWQYLSSCDVDWTKNRLH